LPPKTNVRGAILQGRIGAAAVVERDDEQRVQVLALVFVDALDLHVEQRVWIDLMPVRSLQQRGEAACWPA
jgi:hypothetical protein